MNHDRVQGRRQYLRGGAKARQMKRSDDDLRASADGSVDYLAGELQDRYVIAKDEAKTQINTVDAGNADSVKQRHRLAATNAAR